MTNLDFPHATATIMILKCLLHITKAQTYTISFKMQLSLTHGALPVLIESLTHSVSLPRLIKVTNPHFFSPVPRSPPITAKITDRPHYSHSATVIVKNYLLYSAIVTHAHCLSLPHYRSHQLHFCFTKKVSQRRWGDCDTHYEAITWYL